jgi:AAA+ ATPase superfamily predicted ATPase
LRRFLTNTGGGLAVVYGRRRCGKSTLIHHVANSLDGQAILVGEVKWTGARSSPDAVAADLMARVALAPFVQGRKVIPALWMRSGNTASSVEVVTPDTLLVGLKVTGVP